MAQAESRENTTSGASAASVASGEWRFVQTTELSDRNLLYDVSIAATGSSWAVGVVGVDEWARPMVQRLSGSTWKPVTLPEKFTDPLRVVAASSGKDVWAFGWAFETSVPAIHWNGKKWTRRALPIIRPTDAEAIGPSDVWVVDGTATALHWNGRKWVSVKLPAKATAVYALSAKNVWAAGSVGRKGAVLRWNGKAWKLARKVWPAHVSPDSRTTFEDITVSGKSVWAVGAQSGVPCEWGRCDRRLALRLTDGKATIFKGAAADGYGSFEKVAADGSGGVWTLVQGSVNPQFGRFAANGSFKGYVAAPRWYEGSDLALYALKNRRGTKTLWSVGQSGDAVNDHSDGVYVRTG